METGKPKTEEVKTSFFHEGGGMKYGGIGFWRVIGQEMGLGRRRSSQKGMAE